MYNKIKYLIFISSDLSYTVLYIVTVFISPVIYGKLQI